MLVQISINCRPDREVFLFCMNPNFPLERVINVLYIEILPYDFSWTTKQEGLNE